MESGGVYPCDYTIRLRKGKANDTYVAREYVFNGTHELRWGRYFLRRLDSDLNPDGTRTKAVLVISG